VKGNTPEPRSVDDILFWTMVFPSLLLLVVFFVGAVVLIYTVGDDYHSPVTSPPVTTSQGCPQ
jgi:hypothetical protein